MAKIILFNKPFKVLSQFTDEADRSTLADYLSAPGFRAAGRLDYDSEGLLLLTDNGQLQQQIANPRHKQWKTYWVQVEGAIDQAAVAQLASGVTLKDGATLPARARSMDAPDVWPRTPPVRYRQSIADSWLELAIREGRNRQVRRMTASVGYPTLRLIRVSIGDWSVQGLSPGAHRSLEVNTPTAPARRPSRRKF